MTTFTRGRSAVVAGAMLAALVVSHGAAQERARDRRRFLAADTKTSDDPRRTPVDPSIPAGPTARSSCAAAVCSTGPARPARPATLVVTRNVIAAVLPPTSNGMAGRCARDRRDRHDRDAGPNRSAHAHHGRSGTAGAAGLERDIADSTLRGVERLRYYAESGITSVRDTGSHDSIFRLKAWVRDRRVRRTAHLRGGTIHHRARRPQRGGRGSAPDQGATRLASGADDWRKAVREQFDRGADFIKVGSHFSRDEIRAAVDEAHALGLKITCDCETFYIDWAVDAGVDMIEHPLPRTDEVIQQDGGARRRGRSDAGPVRHHLRGQRRVLRIDLAPLHVLARGKPADAAQVARAGHQAGCRAPTS